MGSNGDRAVRARWWAIAIGILTLLVGALVPEIIDGIDTLDAPTPPPTQVVRHQP